MIMRINVRLPNEPYDVIGTVEIGSRFDRYPRIAEKQPLGFTFHEMKAEEFCRADGTYEWALKAYKPITFWRNVASFVETECAEHRG